MRLFKLHRTEDISGISGTGDVAQGVEFSNGKVVISWFGNVSSITIFNSIYELEMIHGHEGATQIIWV